MFRKIGLLAIVTGSFICASVAAADSGFYLYGAAGASKISLKQGDIDANLGAAGRANLASKVEERDRGLKAQVGWMYNDNFGLEGGYVNLGKARYSATYTGGSSTQDTRVDGFGVSAIVIFPVSGKFSLLAKLGMFDGKVKVDASTSSGATASDSTAKWQPSVGFGAMYDFSKQFAVRGDFDRYSRLGDKNRTGDIHANLFTLGVVYKF